MAVKIQVKTANGIVDVAAETLKTSKVIENMLFQLGAPLKDNETLNLPAITNFQLEAIALYLDQLKTRAGENLSSLYMQDIETLSQNVLKKWIFELQRYGLKGLVEILQAADYLEIPFITKIAGYIIYKRLGSSSSENIRQLLQIEKDFSKQELANLEQYKYYDSQEKSHKW